MKTGLVTFYHIHHYGAVLQAAATRQTVEALGHGCELVDYYVRQDNRLFQPPTSPSAAAHDAHTALHYGALRRRQARFDAFQARHLRLTPHRYASLAELRAACLPYDVLLSGSDQIWNPSIFPDGRFDPVFFGAFTDCRKIAYAPSFGLPRIPQEMQEELRGYLAGYSHLSVRETQGREIVRELTGRPAPVVLDPTLLPERAQWEAMASGDYPAGGYILCYCISRPGALEPYIRRLSRETGLPVVQLCGVRTPVCPHARTVLDAGPAEFLSLFRHADFVLTNSFHGTVFAVQFQKPFFTAVSPAELAAPERSRIFSLLQQLGLAERVIGVGGAAPWDAPVDWEAAETRLQAARKASLQYLSAALEDRPCPDAEAPDTVISGAERPRLAEPNACTGCSACAAVCPVDAIAMERDREGFSVPAADLAKCVRCGRCTAVCPALRPREEAGHIPAAYAAWNDSSAVRRDSTSGGAFTALAEYVLEGGGVVYGAAMDARQHLHHIACFRKEDLRRLRGAKYVQSDLENVFREIGTALKSRTVLFSGTPCQVAGLYAYLGERPENLLTCDLVCHGVPSPGVWEAMAASIQRRRKKGLRAVRFRNKVEGWHNSHFTVVYDDGTVDSRPLFASEYGHAFGRALFLRRSCHQCRYTNLNRPGDFTLGDLWGLGAEEFSEEQKKGVSLLLVNTAHGSHVFDQLQLTRKPFPIERAVAGNPRLAEPVAPAPDRSAFFAAFALEPFEEVRKRFFRLPSLPVRAASRLLSPEIKAGIKRHIRPK